MRRCRVVGCFASSTQQMNSFRPSGVKLSHSAKTFGSIALLLEGLHVLRGQCLGEKRSPRDLPQTPSESRVTSFVEAGGCEFHRWIMNVYD